MSDLKNMFSVVITFKHSEDKDNPIGKNYPYAQLVTIAPSVKSNGEEMSVGIQDNTGEYEFFELKDILQMSVRKVG